MKTNDLTEHEFRTYEKKKDIMLKELKKKPENLKWMDILVYLSKKVNATAFKALASVGFFRGFKDKITRNEALYQYEIYRG